MTNENSFSLIFEELKKILKEYESQMDVVQNTNEAYYLNTRKIHPIYNQITFFAATIIKKNYVSYYLMPVYTCPELLSGISEPLKKRMQGKSCFNFKKPDEELFNELKLLTRKGYERFKTENLI